jgi:hypothetical protein
MIASARGHGRAGLPGWLIRAFMPSVVLTAWLTLVQCAGATSGLIVIPRPTSQPGLSYFRLDARPGFAGGIGAIELRNASGAPVSVRLAAVDGQTLSTLGSSYAPSGSATHGSTAWLALGRRTVRLAPHTTATVPVVVAVPATGRAGDYLSGVSIEALDQQVKNVPRRGTSIASVERYAIGVEISIAGPRDPMIRLTSAAIQRQPGGVVFLVEAQNPGNVILAGVHGWVRITRAGHTVVSRAIEPGTFVAGTSIAYPVPAFREVPDEATRYELTAWMAYPGGTARLHRAITFGHRQAVIQQSYGGRPARHSQGGPAWELVAIAVAVLLYCLLTTGLLLRRRGRERVWYPSQPIPQSSAGPPPIPAPPEVERERQRV